MFVLVQRRLHPRVQFVIRHDCVLLHRRVQLPPGQSSVQPVPDTELHTTLHPPPSQRCAQPDTELQSREHADPLQVWSQRVAELHVSPQAEPQVWPQVPVLHAHAPPSQVTGPVVEFTAVEVPPQAARESAREARRVERRRIEEECDVGCGMSTAPFAAHPRERLPWGRGAGGRAPDPPEAPRAGCARPGA